VPQQVGTISEDGNTKKVARSLPNGKLYDFRGLQPGAERAGVILLYGPEE
jgi:hypothetical protein